MGVVSFAALNSGVHIDFATQISNSSARGLIMFQSFEAKTHPSQGPDRVRQLREQMVKAKVDGFLVPRADEHQGEYVPACAERLQWLTGFTGSAGAALILRDQAIIFVDGRYTLQVRQQTDQDIFTYASLVETPPADWIAEHLGKDLKIAIDPWLHTISEVKQLQQAVSHCGSDLVMNGKNLVDVIWEDRPAPPLEKISIQPQELSGELAKDKLVRLIAAVSEARVAATILTDPSSIAWAFNIRGNDVPHTPLALAFAIVPSSGRPSLFIDDRKLSIETRAYLTQLTELLSPEALIPHLAAQSLRQTIGLDYALAAEKLKIVIEQNGGTVRPFADPARLPRAVKNEGELAGTRAAHLRDGAAMVNFLHWLDGQKSGTVDEIQAVTELENARRRSGEASQMPLRDVSFETISGSGPNGAIIHYRVSTESNRKLGEGELFLIDSGAQYQDGTTDITRTVPIGSVPDEAKRNYTIVLKGLIALSLMRFPRGTRGMDLDPIARMAHWKAGLDYAHGTGHGVGSYLAVHEGPQRLARTGTQPLLSGMILSNEPGYYRQGDYGIRLENLIVVTAPEEIAGGEIAMHGFETLTLCPFDRRMIVAELLNVDERDWLNHYHERVAQNLLPLVEGKAADWLKAATQKI